MPLRGEAPLEVLHDRALIVRDEIRNKPRRRDHGRFATPPLSETTWLEVDPPTGVLHKAGLADRRTRLTVMAGPSPAGPGGLPAEPGVGRDKLKTGEM
jgi:hypothetical protein